MPTIGNFSLAPTQEKEVSLYFHIPFCTRKCGYCHFYVLPDQEPAKEALQEGFDKEWERYLPLLKDKKVVSLYFGGGTPSLYGPSRIHHLIEKARKESLLDAETEITLEANPENISFSLMRDYAQAGINRVSIGIQTLSTTLLALLGRKHSREVAIRSIHETAEAGLSNISIDLMYDLPRQTLQNWEETLKELSLLPLAHLSLYNLTIEPSTLFFKKQKELSPLLPSEETSLAMYEKAIAFLENQGLIQYEISAFAKPGCHSRHNSGYWEGRPFLGFGPSAFSYWNHRRFRNIAHLGKYVEALKQGQSAVDFEEELSREARIRELLAIALRLKKGVDVSLFEEKNGRIDAETKKAIDQLILEGFLCRTSDRLTLSKRGVIFYDTVASELV